LLVCPLYPILSLQTGQVHAEKGLVGYEWIIAT